MPTRAARFLKQKRVPFEIIHYEHLEKGAEFAAQATGFPLEFTLKTLVVEVVPWGCALALIAGNLQLDMKLLARALSAKKAELADRTTAERVTGYHVGGISPFGARQALPVVMDERTLGAKEILINAGQRGTMLKMSPLDVCAVLDCTLAAISRRRQTEAGEA